MDEARQDRYIELVTKYPELTRYDLHSLFPELEELEKHPRVKRILAEIKLDELKQAEQEKFLNEYIELNRRTKMKAQKDRALEVMRECLYSSDINVRFRAAVKVLGRDYARDTKLGELEAQKEISKESPDEPYPEPQRSAEDME